MASAALAVALLGVFLPGPPANADDSCTSACLVVVLDGPGDSETTYHLSPEKLVDELYDTRAYVPGDDPTPAASLYGVLQSVGASQLDQTKQVVILNVTHPNGNRRSLDASDIEDPDGDPTTQPPAVYVNGNPSDPRSASLTYSRPPRAGGPGGGETLAASAGEPLKLTVSVLEQPFTARLKGPTKVEAGKLASYQVELDGAAPSSPRYVWSFGDDGIPMTCTGDDQRIGSSASHSWAQSGRTYDVTVGVCGPDQVSPVTSTLRVTVGSPPPPTTGPRGGNGDQSNGTATGSRKGTGNNANGGTTNGNGSTSGLTGSGTSAATDAAKAAREAALAAEEARRALGQPSGGTVSVAGLVLAADRAVPLTTSPSGSSAVAAAAASRRPGEIPKDWRWLLGLLPVVLLASGTLRQTRWLAPRLPQPPWRTT